MNKLRFFNAFFGVLLGLTLLQSCSKGFNVSPLAPNSPNTQANLLSAFATIGTPNYFIDPLGIQYVKGHLWVTNQSCTLQEWTTIGSAPITTICAYNSGVSFVNVGRDGIDPATGNVYMADESDGQIAVYDPTGNYLTVFGNAQMGTTMYLGYGGPWPIGVAVNSSGTTVYALDQFSNTIYVYSIGGTATNPTYVYQTSFGNAGSGPATLNSPSNLRLDSGGNVWVADTGNHRVAEYNGTGTYLKSLKVSGIDVNFSPVDLLFDGSGSLYSVDNISSVVVKFNLFGTAIGQFGAGVLNNPQGITTDGSGNFFVTNNNPQQIVAFH